MTKELWAQIIAFSIKFGLESAIELLKGISTAATIDDAIAALGRAHDKTAQDYLDAAKAAASNLPTVP